MKYKDAADYYTSKMREDYVSKKDLRKLAKDALEELENGNYHEVANILKTLAGATILNGAVDNSDEPAVDDTELPREVW